MPTPITEVAPARPAPPPAAVLAAPRVDHRVEPCPNRATCTSQTCRRALAFAPETEH